MIFRIDTMELMEDHVHIFVKVPLRYSPPRFVQIKIRTLPGLGGVLGGRSRSPRKCRTSPPSQR